jgi:hypothetical protein
MKRKMLLIGLVVMAILLASCRSSYHHKHKKSHKRAPFNCPTFGSVQHKLIIGYELYIMTKSAT